VDLKALYREVILEHYKQPRNTAPLWEPGTPRNAAAEREALCKNPSCGDRVSVQLAIEDGRVTHVAFQGIGCAISQASASMMTEAVKGQPLSYVQAVRGEFRRMIVDGGETPDPDLLGDLQALQGVAKLHARVKCALCGWSALDAALAQHGDVNLEEDTSLPPSAGLD
jgi:nitrogen fixation NifU-like protein